MSTHHTVVDFSIAYTSSKTLTQQTLINLLEGADGRGNVIKRENIQFSGSRSH